MDDIVASDARIQELRSVQSVRSRKQGHQQRELQLLRNSETPLLDNIEKYKRALAEAYGLVSLQHV
jgi:hypothetical protein